MTAIGILVTIWKDILLSAEVAYIWLVKGRRAQ